METIKVVINTCHGGFGLSEDALERYIKETNGEAGVYEHEIPRDSSILVRIVEEMGGEANNSFSDLKVVEIPADVNWYIDEYDGWEWVDHGYCKQNVRCSHVFKQPDRFDGQAYDIDAVIFWEWMEFEGEVSKSYFTSSDSPQPITFPYTPKREYKFRPTEQFPNEVL